MTSRVAEDLNEQVRAAVDDLGMIAELRFRIDHAEQLHDRFDARELADRRLRHRQQLQPGEARSAIAVLDRRVLDCRCVRRPGRP
jgi:hypothetical protein